MDIIKSSCSQAVVRATTRPGGAPISVHYAGRTLHPFMKSVGICLERLERTIKQQQEKIDNLENIQEIMDAVQSLLNLKEFGAKAVAVPEDVPPPPPSPPPPPPPEEEEEEGLCWEGKVCQTDEFGHCVVCCECKACIRNLRRKRTTSRARTNTAVGSNSSSIRARWRTTRCGKSESDRWS